MSKKEKKITAGEKHEDFPCMKFSHYVLRNIYKILKISQIYCNFKKLYAKYIQMTVLSLISWLILNKCTKS